MENRKEVPTNVLDEAKELFKVETVNGKHLATVEIDRAYLYKQLLAISHHRSKGEKLFC